MTKTISERTYSFLEWATSSGSLKISDKFKEDMKNREVTVKLLDSVPTNTKYKIVLNKIA